MGNNTDSETKKQASEENCFENGFKSFAKILNHMITNNDVSYGKPIILPSFNISFSQEKDNKIGYYTKIIVRFEKRTLSTIKYGLNINDVIFCIGFEDVVFTRFLNEFGLFAKNKIGGKK